MAIDESNKIYLNKSQNNDIIMKTPHNVEMNELSPFEISNPDDEFHAVYWPMEKWVNDSSAAELLNSIMRSYPDLKWDNPLSAQFGAMMSIFKNSELIEELIEYYDYTMVDFMRLMFVNWPEVFAKKRYASALSATIVSCLI